MLYSVIIISHACHQSVLSSCAVSNCLAESISNFQANLINSYIRNNQSSRTPRHGCSDVLHCISRRLLSETRYIVDSRNGSLSSAYLIGCSSGIFWLSNGLKSTS